MKRFLILLGCLLIFATAKAQERTSPTRNIFISYGYSWTPLRDIDFANINEDDSHNLINLFYFFDNYSAELIDYPEVMNALHKSPASLTYTSYPAIGFEIYDEKTGPFFTGASFQLGYTEFNATQQVLFHYEPLWNQTEHDVYAEFDLNGRELYFITKVMAGVWWKRSVFMINFGFKLSFAKRFDGQLSVYDPIYGREVIRPIDRPENFANAAFGVMGGGEYRYHFEKPFYLGMQYYINGLTIYRASSGLAIIPTVYSVSQQTLALKVGYRFW